jgi:predicted RNase H-like nuclease (RuvC/YqgF family)
MFLLLSPTALTNDEINGSSEVNTVQESSNQEENIVQQNNQTIEQESADAQKEQIKWEAMNEMQIALFIINKQIDYLMERIEDNDNRITQMADTYEDRLKKEIARNQELTQKYEEKIKELEQDIGAYRNNVSQLERDMAIFASESGLYLKILLGFLVGSIFGIVLAGLLQLWKRGSTSKNKSASA